MYRFIYCLSVLLLLSACSNTTSNSQDKKHVSIEKNADGAFQFYVDGEPFTIKGVGFETDKFSELKEAGGNAFRTWRTDKAQMELDSAAKYGFKVALGLDIDKELHGFDYNDEAAVAAQLKEIKEQVLEFKDHPSLLCWVAGNELNLLINDDGSLRLVNPKTYVALNEIVQFIHEVDPYHPVTTTFAGGMKEHVDLCRKHCPDLDFLSYQVYGGLGDIHNMARAAAPDMPFAVTEFGPMGHWEMPSTNWGREIEEPSAAKAKGYAGRMKAAFRENPDGLCLGGFAFLWGQKQERTPTWYGMLGKNGESTATVDELTKIWTGAYPANRAPAVNQIFIDGNGPMDNLTLSPSSQHVASVEISDPENDKLEITYVIMSEVRQKSDGGAFEQEPEEVDFKHQLNEKGELIFTAPAEEGDYRLFVYAYDKDRKLGYSNIPFFVK